MTLSHDDLDRVDRIILNPPTYKQLGFIRQLAKKHKMTGLMLDLRCEQRFGVPLASIDKSQASALIDEMSAWESVPADLRRASGQLDLFGETP